MALQNLLSPAQATQLTECFASIKQLPEHSSTPETILKKLQPNNTETGTQNIEEIINLNPFLTIVLENTLIISIQISLDVSHPVSISFLDEDLDKKDLLSELEISTWTAYLEEEKYSSIRDTVIEKLGSKTKTDLIRVEVTQQQ
ncbi:hypothetical protein D3C76_1276370 [compost metagenome]